MRRIITVIVIKWYDSNQRQLSKQSYGTKERGYCCSDRSNESYSHSYVHIINSRGYDIISYIFQLLFVLRLKHQETNRKFNKDHHTERRFSLQTDITSLKRFMYRSVFVQIQDSKFCKSLIWLSLYDLIIGKLTYFSVLC